MKLYSLLLLSLLAVVPLPAGVIEARSRPAPLEGQPNTNNRATYGYTINDHGTVAGMVYRWEETPYPSGSIKGVFVHAPATGFQEIGDYEGAYSQPARINNRGQFTVAGGRGYETNGVCAYVEDAVRYTPGIGFERLGDLGGQVTRALGINSQGDIVGWALHIIKPG
jgi:hypothetical protein